MSTLELQSFRDTLNSQHNEDTPLSSFWYGRQSVYHIKYWSQRKQILNKALKTINSIEKNNGSLNDEDNKHIACIYREHALYFAEYCRCKLSSKPSAKHEHYDLASGTLGVFFVCGQNCQHKDYMKLAIENAYKSLEFDDTYFENEESMMLLSQFMKFAPDDIKKDILDNNEKKIFVHTILRRYEQKMKMDDCVLL